MSSTNVPHDPCIPPRLLSRVKQIIEIVPPKYWFQILEYVASVCWPALKRMHARTVLAETNHRRYSWPQETASEVWEVTREEFEQAMVGHH